MYDARFRQPATICIAGPTSSGKTTIAGKIASYKKILFDKPPGFTVLCYSEDQDLYDDLYNKGHVNKLLKGYPSYHDLSIILKAHKKEGSLLIIDDSLQGITEDITKIFFQLSHHSNTSCCFISQNLFYDNKHYRSLTMNCMYKFLTNNPGNKTQIFHLAKQISPYNTNYIVQAYNKATSKSYGYLLIDLHQRTPLVLMLRTHIFPDEPKPMKCFIEKSH